MKLGIKATADIHTTEEFARFAHCVIIECIDLARKKNLDPACVGASMLISSFIYLDKLFGCDDKQLRKAVIVNLNKYIKSNKQGK